MKPNQQYLIKKALFSMSFFLFFSEAYSQKHKPDHVSFSVTTLHTAYPFARFSKLFIQEFHPGYQVGTGFNWREKGKHDWFQTFDFNYSYHRFVQHSFALYSEFGYRHKFHQTFAVEAKLGAGYLHAIPVGEIFKLTEDGVYKKKMNWGRPQGMVAFSLGINKKVSATGLAIFLQYQQRVQLPFIKSYVPLLPSNMLMAGVKVPLKLKTVPD